ncbi:unnamed protein product [Fraxinus pennsylvanica]|uniref:Uncharacterized protein n=1 Tax=Fraxinus pennsylvanica TaxID=56036 RepID=A0AAD1ZWY9_9LAMI|nr:unnamed protein product [Fraxinus pennsylvanica]
MFWQHSARCGLYISNANVAKIISRIPADSETKWYKNPINGVNKSKNNNLRMPPTSNATRAKYGNASRPISKVPSRSATILVWFPRPLELHLLMGGKRRRKEEGKRERKEKIYGIYDIVELKFVNPLVSIYIKVVTRRLETSINQSSL